MGTGRARGGAHDEDYDYRVTSNPVVFGVRTCFSSGTPAQGIALVYTIATLFPSLHHSNIVPIATLFPSLQAYPSFWRTRYSPSHAGDCTECPQGIEQATTTK